MRPTTYIKAIVGGLSAAAAFAIPVVDNGLVPSEALGIALAFLGGLGLVYVAPANRETPGGYAGE